jgi:ABC-type transport system involved in multi-copper enzyme maturation permease subunit
LFAVLLLVLIKTRPIIGEVLLTLNVDNDQMEQLPQFMKDLISDGLNTERLKTDDQFFLLSQWFAKNFGQFLPFFALIIAFPVFSRETEKKTIYFLLAKKNRRDVFDGKVFSSYSIMIILVLFFSFLAPVVMMLFGYDVNFNKELFQMIAQQLVAVSFFYSVFILFSIVFNDQLKPVILGIILLVIMPFTSMIKGISWMNLYPYILGNTVLKSGDFDWISTSVLLSLTVFMYFLGKKLFLKKEF